MSFKNYKEACEYCKKYGVDINNKGAIGSFIKHNGYTIARALQKAYKDGQLKKSN